MLCESNSERGGETKGEREGGLFFFKSLMHSAGRFVLITHTIHVHDEHSSDFIRIQYGFLAFRGLETTCLATFNSGRRRQTGN